MPRASVLTIRPLVLAFAALALFPSAGVAATGEESAVLQTVQAMFDGMSHRDADAMKAAWIPAGTLVLMRDGKPAQMSIESFADRLGAGKATSKTTIEERIHDPLVRIDNDLAVVWAPFDFLVDGKVDHCGTDLIDLVRVDGKWLIASVADTGRKTCADLPVTGASAKP